MKSGLNFSDVLLFIAVADGGSFVAGGRAHGLTGSAASKAIGRLEARLDARLFQRTSHSISLTDEGRTFYEHAQRVHEALQQAESSLSRGAGAPRGLLRLSLPDAFGRRVALPIVARYLELWPKVRVELSFTDRPVNLVEEGFDLVVRLGATSAPRGIISRVVSRFRAYLCAAPDYLERRGHPPHLEALTTHDCIVFRTSSRSQVWRFPGADGSRHRVPVTGRVRADSGEAIREAALRGLGIAYLPDFLIDEDIRSGRLVEVLPEVAHAESRTVALYPSKRHLEPRVRRFIDLLIDELPHPNA
ncbi:MAG: LysR substrate-binding domain-containing protein [Myxococcota bacterium]